VIGERRAALPQMGFYANLHALMPQDLLPSFLVLEPALLSLRPGQPIKEGVKNQSTNQLRVIEGLT
jgi:hypothetical protein